MIKKIGLFVLGILLLPFYPFLKRMGRGLSEKMRIQERVVVVTRTGDKKRRLMN